MPPGSGPGARSAVERGGPRSGEADGPAVADRRAGRPAGCPDPFGTASKKARRRGAVRVAVSGGPHPTSSRVPLTVADSRCAREDPVPQRALPAGPHPGGGPTSRGAAPAAEGGGPTGAPEREAGGPHRTSRPAARRDRGERRSRSAGPSPRANKPGKYIYIQSPEKGERPEPAEREKGAGEKSVRTEKGSRRASRRGTRRSGHPSAAGPTERRRRPHGRAGRKINRGPVAQ